MVGVIMWFKTNTITVVLGSSMTYGLHGNGVARG